MHWIVWTLAALLGTAALAALATGGFVLFVHRLFGKHITNVFTRKPLLLAESPERPADAEDFDIPIPGGGRISASLLPRRGEARRGLLVFCHEFTGDRWLCLPYLEPLRDHGYDVLAFDFRGHGRSDLPPHHEPLQWVTDDDVAEVRAAVAWAFAHPLHGRGPIALFGVSKGGGCALAAAAAEPRLAAVAVDGAYPTHGTVAEYMARWVGIFSQKRFIYERLPHGFYAALCWVSLRERERQWGVKYPALETALRAYRGPLLMIHGGRDNYIPQTVADRFFAASASPAKEFWLVEGAKHNRCAQKAGPEYHRRLAAFYNAACAAEAPARRPAVA